MALVRRVRPGDGPLLRDVRLRALQTDPDAFGSSYEVAVALSDDEWEEAVGVSAVGSDEIILVAETRDRFVGMAGAFTLPETPRTRNLYGMWVAPDARRSGLGAQLVETVVDWSKAAGADDVSLWVVESNLDARHLYEKAGFAPTGTTQPLPSNPELTEIELRLRLD